MKRFLWLGLVLSSYLICTGCGDTFRPIIIPNPPTFPNPAAAHSVVTISDNGSSVVGGAMVIDVSGDSDVSEVNANIHPVHAVQQTASSVLVLNQAVTGLEPKDGNCQVPAPTPPGVFNVCPSLTKLTFNGTSISTTTTISLPINSAPNFVAVAPLATTAFVTLPNYPPNPTDPTTVVPSVGAVNTTTNALAAVFPVGNNPYALAVTPDNTKLYVANFADNTVGGYNINAAQNSYTARIGSPNGTTSPPIWLASRNDNQQVYVLEQNGTLDWIDTSSTAGPDTLKPAGISVPGASALTYDGISNRLLIAGGNPGTPELEVVDVSGAPPAVLAGGPIAIPFSSIARSSSDVCSTYAPPTAANPETATSAAILPDKSKIYVGSYAQFAVNVTISSAKTIPPTTPTGTSYTYTLQSSVDLLPGMIITITGVTPSDYNGTFQIQSVSGGTFQLSNIPTEATATGGAGVSSNICPQVTVFDAKSYALKTQVNIPGVSNYNNYCTQTVLQQGPRFRMQMAAAGDSTRAYLSSCDGGNVNFIDTSTDTYIQNLPTPVGSGQPIPPNPLNPPQNPVFMIAGP